MNPWSGLLNSVTIHSPSWCKRKERKKWAFQECHLNIHWVQRIFVYATKSNLGCNRILVKTPMPFFIEMDKTIVNSFAEERKRPQVDKATPSKKNNTDSISITPFRLYDRAMVSKIAWD